MILISYLQGPYNSETSEGRGANAAYNVVRYIEEGKKILENKMQQFMNGEISMNELMENKPIEALSKVYIPYMPVDEETGKPDYKYGLAFASVYLSAFDFNNKGFLSAQEAGPLGHLLDFTLPCGKITPGKFLAWFIFQDCTEIFSGVISPREAGIANMVSQREPAFVKEQLNKIYFSHGIDKLEKEFKVPQPVK